MVLQHRLDDKGGEIALLGVGARAQAAEVVIQDLDRRLRHQRLGDLLQGCDWDHCLASRASGVIAGLAAIRKPYSLAVLGRIVRNYWTYILAGKPRRPLIGVTGIIRRVERHRAGKASNFTRKYKVHRLDVLRVRPCADAIQREDHEGGRGTGRSA
jgi:hypothetical protein